MSPIPWQRLKRPLAYVGLGVFAFFVFLFLTFPYSTLTQRISMAAQEAGFTVTLGSLGPGFFGVTAKHVELSRAEPPAANAPPSTPLKIDSLSLRPSLWPLGVALRASALGGTVHAVVGGMGDASVHVSISGLDFSKGNFKGFTGVDLVGGLNGELSLDIPSVAAAPNGGPKTPDLSQASGLFTLALDNCTVRGGTATVPLYGQMTPIDLPRLKLGNLDAAIRFDKGAGTVERLTGVNGDLDLIVTGTLKLARQLLYSETNLQVKLKPTPELMKNGFVGMGISALPPDPSNPGFRGARVTGLLGSPAFQPGS